MSSPRSIPYHLHIFRAVFASLAVVAVGVLYLPSFNIVQQTPSTTPQSAVLAYATSINASDLAAATNAARAQNGLGALNLNAKLSVSAQLKANDMVTKDYWAHVSPDGTQPWYWFTQAGYDYTNAGENLAYGFATSDAVTTGWMNSAGHRANILGNYQDMGFGIANGENFQGAQNTVVVAHYGTPRASQPAPTPITTPTQTPAATPTVTQTTPTTRTVTEPTPAPAATTPTPETTQTTPAADEQAAPTTPTATTQTPTAVSVPAQSSAVPVWKQLLSGTAPLLVIVSAAILTIVIAGYIATHLSLARHAAMLSEQYVLHHPMIDASVAVGAALIMLVTTIGHIR